MLLLESNIYWRDRYHYLEMMENFVNNTINGIEFQDQFTRLYLKHGRTFDNQKKKL